MWILQFGIQCLAAIGLIVFIKKYMSKTIEKLEEQNNFAAELIEKTDQQMRELSELKKDTINTLTLESFSSIINERLIEEKNKIDEFTKKRINELFHENVDEKVSEQIKILLNDEVQDILDDHEWDDLERRHPSSMIIRMDASDLARLQYFTSDIFDQSNSHLVKLRTALSSVKFIPGKDATCRDRTTCTPTELLLQQTKTTSDGEVVFDCIKIPVLRFDVDKNKWLSIDEIYHSEANHKYTVSGYHDFVREIANYRSLSTFISDLLGDNTFEILERIQPRQDAVRKKLPTDRPATSKDEIATIACEIINKINSNTNSEDVVELLKRIVISIDSLPDTVPQRDTEALKSILLKFTARLEVAMESSGKNISKDTIDNIYKLLGTEMSAT